VVHEEYDEVGEVPYAVESIEWFAPQRPVSGTISIVDAVDNPETDRWE
jgi:hypothetical protein